jgi:type IV pilus assembly protein PilB
VAAVDPTVHLSGLARRLVEDGLLTAAQAQKAYEDARKGRVPFVAHLTREKLANSLQLALAASEEFGVPLLNLDALDFDHLPLDLVNAKLIQERHALPVFKRGTRLFVAVSDPTNLRALDDIKFQTGVNTEPILAEEDKLSRAIERVAEAKDTTLKGFSEAELDNLDIEGGEAEPSAAVRESDVEDAPIVRFVNKVLLDAINKGASDVHFEPYEKTFRVRVRIDGILYEVASPPAALAARLAARLKVMSRLDIAERRLPQDGRIKLRLSQNRAIDFRVNTLPTLWGEKVVLRILDSGSARIGVDSLGFEEDQKKVFLEVIHRPQGMVLVTGPTGSGKTVTQYTALNILNTADKNISTAEDPVEIYVGGINQVNIAHKIGLSFAEALRAFLRQDPDIIMVGEIRDLETADIAIKAAQTGHMVLSTLHTNDAPQTLTRLVNMGVPPYNIASSVSLIIAQRLARRLCDRCKAPADIPKAELLREGFREDELAVLKIYRAVGCDQCTNGYKGRVGVFQVLPMSEAIGRTIMEGGNAMQIADQAAREGVNSLRQSGLRKVRAGSTSLAEVNRVITE